jgi:hypothetical protein
MVQGMKDKGLAYESEGALVVDVKEDTDKKEVPPCMILKSDGASLYTTTDLATLVWRVNDYNPDRIIYVVDNRQEMHFVQVFRCAKKAGIVKEDTSLEFLGFGTMNGLDGKPFKTRDGGVMRLEYLLNDTNEKMYSKITDNNNMKSLNDNTFKERTDFYRVNLPIIPQKKKLKISYSVILRNLISKTAQRISRAIDFFKKGDYNNALKHISEARNTYENNIKNQNDFLKKIQNVINDNNNANVNANYNMNINNINFSFLDSSSLDINNNLNGSNMMDRKNDSLLKIANFINAVSNDLNLCAEIIKMRDLNKICQMFSIQQSLSFYRVVIFDDNRFLEDNYLNMN